LYAGTESSSKLFALPVKELETVATEWLSRSGFETQRAELDPGGVRFTITRPAEKWQIVLKPHSALATEIHVGSANNALNRGNTIEQMAAYILEYIEGTSAKKERFQSSISPGGLISDRLGCLFKREIECRNLPAYRLCCGQAGIGVEYDS
jgi:hypothetical protein